MRLRTGAVGTTLKSTVVLALLLLVGRSAGQVTPSDDAYVNSAASTTNFGGAATLNLASGSQTSYIRFDLSSVPSTYTGAQVAKATLKLYVNSVTTGGNFNIDLVSGTWSEKTLTYSLQPALTTTISSSVPLVSGNRGGYLQIDLTSTVQDWLNGISPNDGIALVANSPLAASFTTKENTGTSHPPELDIVFFGSGAAGPQGPAGPQGIPGLQGPLGLSGPMGPVGPQGPTGPVGIVNRGTWSPSTQYQGNDTVSYNGSSWIALLPNLAAPPNPTSPAWQLLSAKGINNQGAWVQTVQYQVDDGVVDGGQFWLAIAPNIASEPSTTNGNWQLIASRGAKGATGPVGPQGPQGIQGLTGPAGIQGLSGPQGPIGPMGLIGPIGPAGPQGNAGPAGPVGITNRGPWTAGVAYSANDAVSDQGQYWLATGSSNGAEPGTSNAAGVPSPWLLISAKGSDGAIGPIGPLGPMGLPGPQGPVGPAGIQGIPGPTGLTGLPGTGILNGSQDFTASGTWLVPTGVTRVIVELWGAGGGGGSCSGTFCFTRGGGGGGGAYSRSVLPVTPGSTYTVVIGTGGLANENGGSSSFSDSSNIVLLTSGGGLSGVDEGFFQPCYPNCGFGGQPDPQAQVGHSGAAGSPTSICPPVGGPGYPVQTLSSTIGGGGTGGIPVACGTTTFVSIIPVPGQNGYALLTW